MSSGTHTLIHPPVRVDWHGNETRYPTLEEPLGAARTRHRNNGKPRFPIDIQHRWQPVHPARPEQPISLLSDIEQRKSPNNRKCVGPVRHFKFVAPIGNITERGEVAERSKAHAWNACRRETASRVRIPVSPPAASKRYESLAVVGRSRDSMRFGDHASLSNGRGVTRKTPKIIAAKADQTHAVWVSPNIAIPQNTPHRVTR